MNKKESNKIINEIDYKYGKLLKVLAREELKKFYAIPLEIEDLYNCFMYEIPKIINKIESENHQKFLNTLKLYARRFFFKKFREYTAQKYQVLNKSGQINDRVLDFKPTTSIIDFTILNYIERIIYKSLIEEKNAAKKLFEKLGISISAAANKIKRFKIKFKNIIQNN